MTPDRLIPVISMHKRTANLSKLFDDASMITFNPVDLYDLNDALFDQISFVTPGALRNSDELHRIKMQAMVTHRLLDGTVMVLMNGDDYWSQRTSPSYSDLIESGHGPLHTLAEQTLLGAICNMGIESTDAPAGLPFKLPYDMLRQMMDLTVCGFNFYTKMNARALKDDYTKVMQIDAAIQVRSPLYAHMIEKGYTWKQVDQHFVVPGETEPELGNSDTTAMIHRIYEDGFDNIVTVKPGLE